MEKISGMCFYDRVEYFDMVSTMERTGLGKQFLQSMPMAQAVIISPSRIHLSVIKFGGGDFFETMLFGMDKNKIRDKYKNNRKTNKILGELEEKFHEKKHSKKDLDLQRAAELLDMLPNDLYVHNDENFLIETKKYSDKYNELKYLSDNERYIHKNISEKELQRGLLELTNKDKIRDFLSATQDTEAAWFLMDLIKMAVKFNDKKFLEAFYKKIIKTQLNKVLKSSNGWAYVEAIRFCLGADLQESLNFFVEKNKKTCIEYLKTSGHPKATIMLDNFLIEKGLKVKSKVKSKIIKI